MTTPKKLTNLQIDEISLVDQGANPGAHISFFKRKGTDMNLEELQKRLSELEAENVILKAKACMTDQEKAFYDTLSEEDKTSFSAMDAEGRKAKMGDKLKKSLIGDEVEAIEKSLAEATEAVTKANEELAKRDEVITKKDEEIAKLKEDKENAELRAEVEKRFPLSKGTTEEKMVVLKSIKAMESEAVQKALLDNLDQVEQNLADLAKVKGSNGDQTGKEPKEALDAMAKAKAEKDGITFEQAFAKCLDTPEGKKLWAESRK